MKDIDVYRKLTSGRRSSSQKGGSNFMEDEREEFSFHHSQYVDPFPIQFVIPWKSIVYAVILFIIGSILIIIGTLSFIGTITDGDAHNRSIPMLVLGSLLFIPGMYFSRIAYLSYVRTPGFDYSQIPDF